MPVFLLTDASLSLRAEAFPTPDVTKIKLESRWIYNPEEDPEGRYIRNGRFLRFALFTEDGITPMGVPGDPNAIHAITGLEHQENSDPRNRPDIRTLQMEKRMRKLEKLLREDAERFYEFDAPFDKADIGVFAKRCERIAMPETNWSGQLADILKQETHIRPVTFNIYRGEPMIPSEVEGFINYLLENPEITEGRLTAADVFGKEKVHGLI